MPRKDKNAKGPITSELAMEQFKDFLSQPEVEGALLVAVVNGDRVVLWGADHEKAALGCMTGAAELQGYVAGWLGNGGMRPGPQTH